MSFYNNSKEGGGYHLGHVFMDKMSSKEADGICTIDAATGKKETYGSVLSRSVALAVSLRRAGLQPGDVLLLGGTLHLDSHIPHYSALLNGLPSVGIDPYSTYDEIKAIFEQAKPKIAFCQQQTVALYKRAAQDVGIDVIIVTFDDGECTLSKFLETYGGNEPTEEFKPADFDTEKIYAWLILTSGSTGESKLVAFKHKHVIEKLFKHTEIYPSYEDKMTCDFSTVQGGLSNFKAIYYPLMTQSTTLKSNYYYSDIGDLIDVINKYRPAGLHTIPPMISGILNHEKYCDMTCFDKLIVSGSKVSEQLMTKLKISSISLMWIPSRGVDLRVNEEDLWAWWTHADPMRIGKLHIKRNGTSSAYAGFLTMFFCLHSLRASRMRPDAVAMEFFGMSETLGPILVSDPSAPLGSCGVSTPDFPVKLVDPETGVEITQPNVTGELLYKGPCFTEYYNNPEATAKAFTEDGWFKTGDLFYRDENNYYYFVERIGMLIECHGKISPQEVEEVILRHRGVQYACVIGIPDPHDGQHPVACIVRNPGCEVTAQEIKDLVAEKLSAHKQLRGGVVFLDKLPRTPTDKVVRSTLRQMVLQAQCA